MQQEANLFSANGKEEFVSALYMYVSVCDWSLCSSAFCMWGKRWWWRQTWKYNSNSVAPKLMIYNNIKWNVWLVTDPKSFCRGLRFWFSHFLFYFVADALMCQVLRSTSCLCLFNLPALWMFGNSSFVYKAQCSSNQVNKWRLEAGNERQTS